MRYGPIAIFGAAVAGAALVAMPEPGDRGLPPAPLGG